MRKELSELSGISGTYRSVEEPIDRIDPEDGSPDNPSNNPRSMFSLPRFRKLFGSKKSHDLPQMIPTSKQASKETKHRLMAHLQPRFEQLEPEHFQFLKGMGFKFHEKLGEGGYGQVYRVTETVGDGVVRVYASKVVSVGKFEEFGYKDAVKRMKSEDKFFRELDHDHIVRRIQVMSFYDHRSEFPEMVHLLHFMELMDNSLFHLIRHSKGKRLTEDESRDWFGQVSSGLTYLHERNICHLDIKPENILYKKVGKQGKGGKIFKLADFGWAVEFEHDGCWLETDNWFGTLEYRAPEVESRGRVMAKPVDIYALGITLCESLTGYVCSRYHIQKGVGNDHNRRDAEYSLRLSKMLAQLVAQMTNLSPENRPSARRVSCLSYISLCGWLFADHNQ